MSTSFYVKVLVFKLKLQLEGSPNFAEWSLREKCANTEFFLVRIWTLFTQWLMTSSECHNNKTCIYQSMRAFIEQMVNLNKAKKGWINFPTKSN